MDKDNSLSEFIVGNLPKPPADLASGDMEVLSDEEIKRVILENHCSPETTARDISITDVEESLIKAQRDADQIKCNAKIEQAKKETREKLLAEFEWLDKARTHAAKKLGIEDGYLQIFCYSNIDAWRDCIDDGVAPEDAVNEDLSYAD